MTNTQHYSNQIKTLSSKLLSLCAWQRPRVMYIRLLVREFPIAAVLNSSCKSRFPSEFSRFSRIKKFGHRMENKKPLRN